MAKLLSVSQEPNTKDTSHYMDNQKAPGDVCIYLDLLENESAGCALSKHTVEQKTRP